MDNHDMRRPGLDQRSESSWHPALRSRNSDTDPPRIAASTPAAPALAVPSEDNDIPQKPSPSESLDEGKLSDDHVRDVSSIQSDVTSLPSHNPQTFFQQLNGDAAQQTTSNSSPMTREILSDAAATELKPANGLTPEGPEATYEHHADITEADEAVDEAPTLSLLSDMGDDISTPLQEHTLPEASLTERPADERDSQAAPVITATSPLGQHMAQPLTASTSTTDDTASHLLSRQTLHPIDTAPASQRIQPTLMPRVGAAPERSATASGAPSMHQPVDTSVVDQDSAWTGLDTASTASHLHSAVSDLPSAITSSSMMSSDIDSANSDASVYSPPPGTIPERYRGMVDTGGNLAAWQPEIGSASSEATTDTSATTSSANGTITPTSALPSAVSNAVSHFGPESAVTRASDSTASVRGSYSDLSSARSEAPESAATHASDSTASVRGSYSDLPSARSEAPESAATHASDSTASVRGSYSDLPSALSHNDGALAPEIVMTRDDTATSAAKSIDAEPVMTDHDNDFAAMLAQASSDMAKTSLDDQGNKPAHDAKWDALDDDDDDDFDDFSAALKAASGSNPGAPVPAAPGTGPSTADRYRPANPTPASALPTQPTTLAANPYQPVTQFLGGLPAAPAAGVSTASSLPGLQRPAPPGSARSFVDQAKSGYASPYDLPTDIVQPRKRQVRQVSQPVPTMAAPPPRSTSVTSNNAFQPPGQPMTAGLGAPAAPSMMPGQHNVSAPPTAGLRPGSTPSFFEDLPVASKLRPRPSGDNLTAQQNLADQARPPPASRSSYAPPPMFRAPSGQQQPPLAMAGLQQPERLPLIPDETVGFQQPSQSTAVPQRYSPHQNVPGHPPAHYPAAQQQPSSRYSPAPQGVPSQTFQQPPSHFTTSPPSSIHLPRSQSFVPKTSSPLVNHDTTPQTFPAPMRSGSYSINSSQSDSRDYGAMDVAHPGMQRIPSGYAAEGPIGGQITPPVRSRTQSPSHGVPVMPPTTAPQIARPFSAMDQLQQKPVPQQRYTSQPVSMSHRRKFSREYLYAAPEDERALDPLERWKGHPIFRWSSNGALISSFPKQTPFYVAGQTTPTIKCTAGPIVIHDNTVTFPLDTCNAKFPGPLNIKGKSKKKELLAWLSEKVTDLQAKLQQAVLDLSLPLPLKKRAEEKIILWKAVKVLVEQDNVLEGKEAVAEAVRVILTPSKAATDLHSPVDRPKEDLPKFFSPSETLDELRKLLSLGKREDAVWYAVERQQWAHAMLISSTLGPAVWKQLTQEFVRSQVKGRADDCESLAALYEIFAGNHEECIDALVPPSARAGLQMINRRESLVGGQRDPLDGLEQWRDTLSLIISNRSKNDGQAIAALGRLLASYGRIEAAHTCCVFARSYVNHSGRDDPEATFVLLGADQNDHRIELGADLDSIILSEILEFTLTLAPAAGASTVLPHLQSYKILHAYQLAEHGLTTKAQSYCDAIISAVKSSTKHSPYYHQALMASVDELSRCLSQSAHAGSSSGWVSKLSSDKVSGSVWKRFNSFVAGDENDGGAAGKEGIDGLGTSPFARVTGETPSASRTPSNTDLYSAMNSFQNTPNLSSGQTGAGVNISPSKYAPVAGGSGRYTPGPPSGGAQPTQYVPRQVQATGPTLENRHLQRLHASRPEAIRAASDYHIPYNYASGPSTTGLMTTPMGAVPNESMSRDMIEYEEEQEQPQSAPATGGLAATFGSVPGSATSSKHPMPVSALTNPSSAASNGYGSPAGYEPSPYSAHAPSELYSASSQEMHTPSEGNGYQPSTFEPPEFKPYVPEPDDDEDEEGGTAAPTRDALGNDDTADRYYSVASVAPPAVPPKNDRAAADRETDELFRKAAEADALKAKMEAEAKVKKGWIPSWLKGGGGGGSSGSAKGQDAPSSGPIKAKLGEENAFYFDKTLNKWVNKKAGADATPSTPTPPPPKSSTPRPPMSVTGSEPPSRSASSAGVPPQLFGPPSAFASGTSTRAGTPGPDGGVPSRPETGMSNASSIDDLLSGPRKGGTVKSKKRAGRYVDVMNK